MQAEDILRRSPIDRQAPASPASHLVPIGESRAPKWVPSRYNVRAHHHDGRLVLWNSYTGSMSVFGPDQQATILKVLRRQGFRARCDGIVKYMVDRGFLVKEGTDEFRRLQYDFGREHYRSDTLELILLASEDCNFRCIYCYEDFARGTMLPEVRSGVKKLVEGRLDRLKHLRVSWFGGEPLYGLQALEDLAPYFTEVAGTHSLDFQSHMTTNGYLLTPGVADKLLAWRITDYQITIDGPPAEHDRQRPTRNGGGTFAQILANLRALKKRRDDFSVVIRVNFGPDNHPHLRRLFDIVEKTFAEDSRFSLSFTAVGRWGGPNDADLAVCGREEAPRIKAELRAEARRRGLEVEGGLEQLQGPGSDVCYAARPYNFIIGADGKVMKCTIVLDKDDGNVVGRLRADGEIELDDDKMALWTEPAFERDSQCRKCVIASTCQGIHCPLIRIRENRRPCPENRLRLKSELREILAASDETARRVDVRSTAA